MTNLRTLTGNLSILTAADVVGKLLSFATFPVVVRALGPEVYGKLGFASATVGFFALAASPGFIPWGIREVAVNSGREDVIAAKVTSARIVFGVVAFLLLVLYVFSLAPPDPQIRELLLLSGLSLLISAGDVGWVLVGKGRQTPWATANIGVQCLNALAIFFLIRRPSDAWVIPAAAAVAALAGAVFLWGIVRKSYGLMHPVFRVSTWWPLVPPALLLGLGSLMFMTYDKVDLIIMGYSRSEAEVGVYAASYKLMGISMSFLPILGQVFLPMAASSVDKEDAFKIQAGQYLTLLMGISIPAMIGGWILSEPLCTFLMGSQFKGASWLFALLLPNLLLGGLTSYFAGLRLMVNGRNRAYVGCVTSGGLLNLGLNLILIPLYGAPAAALTTLGSQGLVAASAAYFGRDIPSPPLLQAALRPLFATAVMALGLWGAMRLLAGIHVLGLVGVGAGIFLGAWLLSGKVISWA